MLVRQKKPFYIGLSMLILFCIMFYFLLAPILTGENGQRLTGLQYADEVFNELSKGSSWFIPNCQQTSREMLGKMVKLDIKVNSDKNIDVIGHLLAHAGAENIKIKQNAITFSGNLGEILEQANSDSSLLYNNDGNALKAKYGIEPLLVATSWHALLEPCIKALQKQKLNAEARAVETVIRRGVEPGNNFYGITAKKVSDNIPLLTVFLLFYVLYTIWYGFSIYEIFAGLGLMSAKAEEEELEADERD